jgi:hypothetical protein
MVEVPEEGAKVFSRLGGSGYEVIVHGIHDNEEDIRKRFRCYGDRVTHVHANLSMHGLISESDLRERLAVLVDLGFSGTFTIEFVEGVRNDTPVAIEDLYRNAVRDMTLLRNYLKQG